jgi:two-component system cell cycle sensor histidine kinase/response regulator CckA
MSRESTRLKLEITFGCLVALLVGVGWLGLSRIGQINSSVNEILNQGVVKLQLVDQALYDANSNFRMVTTLILMKHRSRKDLDAYALKREQNRDQIALIKKQVSQLSNTPEETELVENINQAGALSSKSVYDVVNLLRQPGKENEAQVFMAEATVPLLSRYRNSWNAFIHYQEAQIAGARAKSEANYIAARNLSVWLLLAAITLAIAIAAIAIRQMSLDIKNREESKAAIHRLNEDLEKKVAERTADLARTVEALQDEVNARTAREDDLRRLAAIVESSGDAIIATTLNGTITDWNPGAEQMLGYQRGEMIGQPISRILPPDRLGEPTRSVMRLVEGDQVVRYETVRVRKDGKQIHVALTISPLRDANGKVIGDSGILRDISEHKKIEDAHRRSEASFRSFVQNAPYGIVRTTPEGRIVHANPALVAMLGYDTEEEVLGLRMGTDVYRSPQDRYEATMWSRQQDSVQGVECEWKHKTGRLFTIRSAAHVVRDSEGKVEFLEGFIEDISERRAMEQQLRQGQKMEAIGRLAGGVAHDFNNLLGVIAGYAELASEQIDPSSELRNSITQIRKAAERAASLTRQLLAFSRQQVLETRILNLNVIVEDMTRMLPRLLGEDIELEVSLDPALGAVKADQSQIEQVIMNLAVNARDAMPGGGRLVFRTTHAGHDPDLAQKHPAMKPGDYALVTVMDTGMGMDKQTQAHIFEPFFTTKERGRGTGLGLAMVYGFVKQIGGYIWVESVLGAGTTFEIYLPVAHEAVAERNSGPAVSAARNGAGTILLVEDEESLRTLTRNILEQAGYSVLEAANGIEAVELAERYSEPIHGLLTDMVMPAMNGRSVAERVGQLHPEARVAYMSGYTGFSSREEAGLNAVIISKPFTRNQLLQKLTEALELEAKPV